MRAVEYTKLGAAGEHLHYAIHTLLSGGSPLCASTLANAANIVAHDLCEHAKLPRFATIANKSFPFGRWKHFLQMAREDANNAKHAKADRENVPDAKVTIGYANLEGTIVATCLDLRQFRPGTATETAFMIWKLACERSNPSLPRDELASIEWAVPGIELMAREDQLGLGYRFLLECESPTADERFHQHLAIARKPVKYPASADGAGDSQKTEEEKS